MPATILTCPSCGKRMQLAKPLAPGHAVKCPGCATVFRPPAEANADAAPSQAAIPPPPAAPSPRPTTPARSPVSKSPQRAKAPQGKVPVRATPAAAPARQAAAGARSQSRAAKKSGQGRILLITFVLLFLLCGGAAGALAVGGWYFYGKLTNAIASATALQTKAVAAAESPVPRQTAPHNPAQATTPTTKEPPAPAPANPMELIVGKWAPQEAPATVVIEFQPDGTLLLTAEGAPPMKGSYKFVGNQVVEITLPSGVGQTATQKLQVSVTKDELVTTDEGKKVERFRRITGAAPVTTAPPSVGNKSRDLIVGKWDGVDGDNKGATMEFAADGTLTMTVPGAPAMKGKYEFLKDDLVAVEVKLPDGNKIAQKLKVRVTKDDLTTTDEENKVDRYKRGTGATAGTPLPPKSPDWKEFRSPERGFAVRFPSAPKEETKTDATGKTFTYHASLGEGLITFMVMCTDSAVKLSGQDPKKLLDAATAPFAKNLTSKREIKVNDYPGVEMQVEMETNGVAVALTSRIFVVRERMYQVMVTSAREAKDPALSAEFLDSFTLLETTAKPAPEPPPAPKKVATVTASGAALKGDTKNVIDLKVTSVNLKADTLGCMFWADAKGTAFFTLEPTGTIRRISFPDLKEVEKVEFQKKCSWLSPSAEGLLLSLPELQEVWLLDAVNYDLKRKFALPSLTRAVSSWPLSAAFAANGSELYELDLRTGASGKFDGEGPQHPGFSDPVMTLDGKYLFTRGGFEDMHRFAVVDGKLKFDQSSPRIAQGRVDIGIQVSPDSQYVCLPCYAGNYGAGKNGAIFIYPVTNIGKEEFVLEPGAMMIGFDPVGGYIYGQSLNLYTLKGQLLKQYQIGGATVRQNLVHPQGNRFLLLHQDKLALVEVPKQ
jgi:uncharacterized protein (TIGR03066 family)